MGEQVLCYDFNLKPSVYDWIQKRSDLKTLFNRYGFDELWNLNTQVNPKVIAIWEKIIKSQLRNLLPEIFNPPTVFSLGLGVYRNLSQTIYLASVFHSLGEQVGPFSENPRLKDSFQKDILLELAATCLLITNLAEFPEVAQLILLQCLFWIESHFSLNPKKAWVSSYLWYRFKNEKALYLDEGKYAVDLEKMGLVAKQVLLELNVLATEVGARASGWRLVQNWFDQQSLLGC